MRTWPFYFLFAALTDWLDGRLARKFGPPSSANSWTAIDKVLTLGMFVSLLALGELEDWALFPVLLILSREFLITGLRLVAAGKARRWPQKNRETERSFNTCISLYLGKIALMVDFPEVFSGSLIAWPIGQLLARR